MTAEKNQAPGPSVEEEYGDIIDLPHHVSAQHPQMSLKMRAAQFAPFAALTRFGETIAQVRAEHDRDFELDVHCADPEIEDGAWTEERWLRSLEQDQGTGEENAGHQWTM